MDFILGLPRMRRQNDSIGVNVDRLTKLAHFIPVKAIYSTDEYAKLYLMKIVRMHGVPMLIILYRGTQFTSHF